MKLKEWFLISLGTLTLITLGTIHSIFGTDSHHWGFIMGTALDFIQGKKLFEEIYIQYGLGQPLLYRFLNLFIPINFTTTGIITAFVYAAQLGVLYAIIRKVGGSTLAMLMYGIAILIHSYSISPWPNYYSGLFLSTAVLMLIQDQRISLHSFLAGIFFFLAFFFRSTYLVSILAATFAYAMIVLFEPRLKSKRVFSSLVVFYICFLAFTLILSLQGDLKLWFEQSIGSGTTKYALGLHDVFKTLRKALWPVAGYLPDHIVNTSFVIFFNTTIYFLFRSTIKRIIPEKVEYVFFALLGLAGLSQGILSYEFFRLQSDCMMIYVIVALLLKSKINYQKWRLGIGIYLLLLLIRFPNASALFPLYDGELASYQESSIPIFRFHRFQPEVKSYYEDLANVVCQDDKKIINLTPDSNLPYLCSTPKNSLNLPFYSDLFINIQTLNYDDQWIITDQSTHLFSPQLMLTKKVSRPSWIRFFKPSEVFVYLK